MKPVEPIVTVELFLPLSRKLIAILKALGPDDWDRPTACAPWSVKDVAAHLLGGSLGRLRDRDEEFGPSEEPALDYAELVSLINHDNEAWVQAARRISRGLLVEFLDLTDRCLYRHFKSLPPDAPAPITVGWAGNDLPPNWFDIAREYTEKWLHQQHIREAVGLPLLTGRKWLYPVLDTFLRGLPHAYRAVEAEKGTSLSVRVSGPAGGEWTLARQEDRWLLFAGSAVQAACRVQIDQDLAWRLFTKGVTLEAARGQVRIEGRAALGEGVLGLVSIMA
jgi:uncharacterized protein (TIGR03083 family)